MIIAVPDISYQPLQHVGAWQCVAPEEMKHAFVRAIARDILAGAEAPVLEKWRHAALSCTAEFKILTSDDDVFFEAFNARERVAADYAGLGRTAYQRIFEIITFRARKIATSGGLAIGPKTLANAFNEHARLSSKSEEVSGEYIAAALNVHDKALKLQPVRDAPPAVHASPKNKPACNQNCRLILGSADRQKHEPICTPQACSGNRSAGRSAWGRQPLELCAQAQRARQAHARA